MCSNYTAPDRVLTLLEEKQKINRIDYMGNWQYFLKMQHAENIPFDFFFDISTHPDLIFNSSPSP
jgi:hypothetical protein